MYQRTSRGRRKQVATGCNVARNLAAAGLGACALLAGGASAASAETVSAVYNTCVGQQKFTDVSIDYHCQIRKVTNAVIYKVIGSSSGSGSFANADAEVTADAPLGLYVKVVSRPGQPVNMQWTAQCSAGYSSQLVSGSYVSRNANRHPLHMPIAHPDSCDFGALASLSRGGHVTVQLIAKVRGRQISDVKE